MRWPWVSRTAFDLVTDERDRLRLQVDVLTDQLLRMQRVRTGLPEVPRQPKPKPETGAIPQDVRELYAGYQSKSIRDEIERQVREMHAAGTPYPEIKRELERQLMEPAEA